jgi:hypothetical protein
MGMSRSLLERGRSRITAYDGWRALLAALAVRDSAANSRPVTLLDMPSRRRSR